MKPSEIFEGENSSLRKTYNEAVKNEKNIKSNTKPKTCFQEFADWLAITAGERDDKFEITASKRAFVATRTKLDKADDQANTQEVMGEQ